MSPKPTPGSQTFEDEVAELYRNSHGPDYRSLKWPDVFAKEVAALHTAALKAELEALLLFRRDETVSTYTIVERIEARIAALTNPQEGR